VTNVIYKADSTHCSGALSSGILDHEMNQVVTANNRTALSNAIDTAIEKALQEGGAFAFVHESQLRIGGT
jgi:hypothetical protein